MEKPNEIKHLNQFSKQSHPMPEAAPLEEEAAPLEEEADTLDPMCNSLS